MIEAHLDALLVPEALLADRKQVLNTQFGSVPLEIAEKINGANDLEQLKNMLKAGWLADSLSGFAKVVRN